MSVLLPRGRLPDSGDAGNGASSECSPSPANAGTTEMAETRRRHSMAAWRLALAFCVAAAADAVFAFPTLLEGFEVLGDVFVAVVLCAILGFNWIIVPALLAEAVPGLDVFPSWTVAVIAIAGVRTMKDSRQS